MTDTQSPDASASGKIELALQYVVACAESDVVNVDNMYIWEERRCRSTSRGHAHHESTPSDEVEEATARHDAVGIQGPPRRATPPAHCRGSQNADGAKCGLPWEGAAAGFACCCFGVPFFAAKVAAAADQSPEAAPSHESSR